MFTLLWKDIVKCYCFREPIKNFFFDAFQMTVKMHNVHLFPVAPNRKLHNKQLISLVFSLRIVNINGKNTQTKNSANERYILTACFQNVYAVMATHCGY